MKSALKVTLDYKDDTILVHLLGIYDLPLLRQSIKEVGAKCRQTGCQRILADARSHVGGISTLDLHQIGETIARELPRGRLVAVVVSEKRLMMDRFLETVAVNRGVPFRLFTDIQEARRWLRGAEAVAVSQLPEPSL